MVNALLQALTQSRNPNLQDIGDIPQISPTLQDLHNAMSGVAAGTAGLPVDLMTTMMRPFGYDVQRPVGGSEWMGEQLGADPESGAFIGGTFGSPDPMDGARLAQHVPALMAAMSAVGRVPKAAPKALANYTPAEVLSDAERAIESRFYQSLSDDLEGSIERYNALPGTRGGKIISADEARELDPDYVQNKTLSAAVHEPSSAFTKELWRRAMAAPGDGPVMLMSGGTGAGKTTSLKHFDPSDYHAVFDSNLQTFDKAKDKIEEALKAGHNVNVVHVWRDPVEAFSGKGGSAISRAMKNEGKGRTVPLEAHVSTHAGSNRTVRQLAEYYADDPRVSVNIVDNTRGKDGSRSADLSILPEDINEAELMDAISAELERLNAAGEINPEVYAGFKGRQ